MKKSHAATRVSSKNSGEKQSTEKQIQESKKERERKRLAIMSEQDAVVVEYVTYGHDHQDQHVNTKYDVDGLTWRRGDLIGKGAFGSVYLATLKEPESKKQMVVKSAELFDSGSLQSEKQVLSILHKTNKCPYIIQCFGDEYTFGENGENVYNVLLEYASGGSLRDQIRKSRGSGLPESDVRLYARSILRGIKHVHDCGFVHLDIKPDNILLVPRVSHTTGSTKFMAKICDFGLAKRANQGKSAVRGTVMYLSPEAVTDGIQEAPSDVWAIGCVVLELLTAKQVWTRKAYWSTEEFVRKIGHKFGTPKIPSGISEKGKEFLKGCFQRKAADRLTIDMLLKLPFVSDLDDEEKNIEIKAEESEPVEIMEENYDEETVEISDEDPSNKVYFDQDAEVVLIEDEEDDLIEPVEDEPSIIYLGTVANHEKRILTSDETIHNHKRRKLMSSSDTNGEEKIWLCSLPYTLPLAAAF